TCLSLDRRAVPASDLQHRGLPRGRGGPGCRAAEADAAVHAGLGDAARAAGGHTHAGCAEDPVGGRGGGEKPLPGGAALAQGVPPRALRAGCRRVPHTAAPDASVPGIHGKDGCHDARGCISLNEGQEVALAAVNMLSVPHSVV
ncbi:unnamed protein product, partial [Heterosigma akashiwo]